MTANILRKNASKMDLNDMKKAIKAIADEVKK